METDQSPKRRSLVDRLFGYIDNRLPSDRLIINVLLISCVILGVITLLTLNKSNTVTVPTSGGTLIEGVIGAPRFVNPVLAITKADHDLVALLYSGLMRLGNSGQLENNLAESVTLSEDGRVYNIVIKNNLVFHDNSPLTADDVAFTIALVQDPELKSPLRGNWTGVEVEVLGEHEINLVLEDAYTPFLENLTMGILPKHIWSELATEELPFSQYNTEPIGTGPYRVGDIKRSLSGLVDEYQLTVVETENSPNIESIVMRFYQNEAEILTALEEQEITSSAALSYEILPTLDTEELQIIEEPLPRVFSLYFNQNKSPVVRDEGVRKALSTVVNRDDLVEFTLNGFGTPTASPIPVGFRKVQSDDQEDSETEENPDKLATAKEILIDAGWTQTEAGTWEKEIDETNTELTITIRTANAPVFEATTEYLKSVWEPLGVTVGVELFEQNDLVQAVIRPRDYEALLFGADIGRSMDYYPFWHSSQREDPGLNVALYTNITTDKILEDLRTTTSEDEKEALLDKFVSEIVSEQPAIFLFNPSFIYVLTKNINHLPMSRLSRPSERFSNIKDWHMSESKVWPLFAN